MFDEAAMADPWERYRACDDDALVDAFVQLGSLERATRAQRLAVLAVLDERQAWTVDGATDVVAWVAATDAVHRSTASDMVDQARALVSLPALAAVAAEGRLSADQLRHVAVLATAETDGVWADEAPGASPDRLRRLLVASRRLRPGEAVERDRRRGVRWWHDDRTGMVRITGRLTADAGAVLAEVLTRHAEQAGAGPDGVWDPFESRCADALVELASAGLAADADHDRACVVLHATPDALQVDGTDVATLDDGTALPTDVARRLACDADRQIIIESEDGTVGIGRKARTVPPWLVRLLRQRDVHCRFPGCDRRRGVQAHHVVHWADLGPTADHNLALLCHRHHQLVHELGWTVTGNPTTPNGLTFHRPDGKTYQPAPAPLTDQLRRRYLRHAGPGRPAPADPDSAGRDPPRSDPP
jgi:hypothetical protein